MTDPDVAAALGRLLPALALIVGALLLVRRWAQRGRGPTHTGVRVLARAGIARGSMVAIVEVADRRFLVGAADHAVTLLSELHPEPILTAAPRDVDSARQDVAVATGRELAPPGGVVDRLRQMTLRTPPDTLPDRPRRALRP